MLIVLLYKQTLNNQSGILGQRGAGNLLAPIYPHSYKMHLFLFILKLVCKELHELEK